MHGVADKLLLPVQRFAALGGAQSVDVALAYAQNGSVGAAVALATKLFREVAAVIGRG
jgi:hypothetical protein